MKNITITHFRCSIPCNMQMLGKILSVCGETLAEIPFSFFFFLNNNVAFGMATELTAISIWSD